MMTATEWAALGLSIKVALVCTLIVMPIALGLAWVLARCCFPGRAWLDAAVHLPLVLPPVVVGYGLLVVLGRQGWVGRWLHEGLGVRVAFTWQAAAVASGVMGLPLAVRAMRVAIELVDQRIEQAAATLGASPWRVARTMTLPLALPGIWAGGVLAFARSLGEFGATITFAGNIPGQTQTLPLAIWTATQTPGADATAWRLVVISIVLSFAALLASEAFTRRLRDRLAVHDA